MSRSTNNPASRQRRKKVLKRAKGFYSGRRKLFQNANETVNRALRYAYRDRRTRKREFRALWIARINAAVRPLGLSYNQFINGLNEAGITVDRKILSELAISDSAAFGQLVDQAKAGLAKKAATAAA
jgi:large subunit ribosomal protein L20